MMGCASPNLYATPRTVEKGAIVHTIIAEAAAAGAGKLDTGAPMLPSYSLRAGVTDNVDIGVRFANLSTLGVDVKVQLARGTIDAAINPGVQGLVFIGDPGKKDTVVTYGHLPLVIGVNASEAVTLYATGGPSFMYRNVSTELDVRAHSSPALRGGLGIQLRVTSGFALTPELTLLRYLDKDHTLFVSAGLGFSFGRLPSYVTTGENLVD